MKYFESEYLNFFKELSTNNNKKWFDENRSRYEKYIREPFKVLVGDLIQESQKIDGEITIEPKDAIFRINNDIRFNPDKPLYKTHLAAVISKYGRKDRSYPGFYFQLGTDKVTVIGGVYSIKTPKLNKLRQKIADNAETFFSIINDNIFKSKYDGIKGEKNKRLPADLNESAKKYPILYNKQFYYTADLPSSFITDEDLLDKLMEYWKAGYDLNKFLIRCLR